MNPCDGPLHPLIKAVAETHKELCDMNELAMSSQGHDLERHKLVIQRAREARDTLKEALKTHFIALGDGRFLCPIQYQALRQFAAINSIDVACVLSKV